MGLGTKPVWRCDVCDHEWLSRDDDKPLRCASCKTPYWNKFERNEKENYNTVRKYARKKYD